jgi:hypothetical protein
MPVLQPPGAPPEAAAQVAADALPEERLAQGARMEVEFQQPVLPVAVVAPRAVQVQRDPQELAQQVLPPPVHWGRPVPGRTPVLRPARQEFAAEQQVPP